MNKIWPAPAKLNLFLHITARRADGYHELQTVFQLLDYGDELEFTVGDSGGIDLNTSLTGVADAQNLVVRAARLLQRHTGCRQGADITLRKRLPLGGGLGGGSSDAATTLMALNRLWRTNLPTAELAALGLQLGADVPVFIQGLSAWAEGVGEQLFPVSLPEAWYLVIAPPVTVSTAEVFSDPELTRDSAPITIADFLSGAGHNDCQPVARDRYPEIGQAIDWLDNFSKARMTGTGACVFARFDEREQAERVRRQLPADWQGFVARGVNRSPVLERVQNV